VFTGTIPPELRSVTVDHAKAWGASDIYIGCSGNFTSERALAAALPGVRLHSNDVSLLTTAMGRWATGQDVPVRLKDDAPEAARWLAEYLDGGVGTVATLQLCTQFLASALKPTHVYHRRQVESYRNGFGNLHQTAVKRLQRGHLKIASYTAKDVVDWIRDDVPREAAVVSFPPFDTNGYENIYKPFTATFEWDEPDYTIFDDDRREELVRLIADRPRWALLLPNQPEQLAGKLRAQIQPAARSRTHYLFAEGGPACVVAPSQVTAPVYAKRLAPGEQLGERLHLVNLTAPQFSSLRAQYLDPKIAPATPMISVGVAVDGVLIGAFGYARPQWKPTELYLMSDFCVAPTDYRALSKLVLYAAMSKEGKRLAERTLSQRLTHLGTTAFSDRPSSAKYGRGGLGFVLSKRSEPPGAAHRYQLQYTAPLGRWSLAEGYQLWQTRSGARA
jgi:hypothetical protein